MWPWQRVRNADLPTGGVAVEVVAPRPEWTALAPIQRTVDTLRPVAPQQEFADSLVSWRNPSFLAPLGHLVSSDAPAGVIHRLIEPAAPPSDHPTAPTLTFATAPPRVTAPPRAGVVQRMLAAISPRAIPEPTSPDMAPSLADHDSAPNSAQPGAWDRDSAGVRPLVS